MFKNYLRIALRNLLKYKSFSAINIVGMGISLASFILIFVFVQDELQVDRYHPEGERVYRLYTIMSSPEAGDRYTPMVQPVLATKLQEEFPEVELTARILGTITEKQITLEGEIFSEPRGAYGEGSLFEILNIPILKGDPNNILESANTMAISSSIAQKYFGSDNPIGKNLKIEGIDHEITHVYADFPEKSHVDLDLLISFKSLSWLDERIDSWGWHQMYTYFKLKEGTNGAELESKFQDFYKKESAKLPDPPQSLPYFQNLEDVYLESSHFQYEHAKIGNKQTILILVGAGAMILLISCFNFINLSTARAVKRMREVGVRKVLGAQKSQLKIQFLMESCTFTFFGLTLAIFLAYLAIPFLSEMTGKTLAIPVTMETILFLLGFSLILGIISGSYPAFLLSSYLPAEVISGIKQGTGRNAFFRKPLVIFQFVLSFFLIIGAWIVIDQNELITNKDLGFDKEALLVVYGRGVKGSQLEGIKSEVLKETGLEYATWGYGLPGDMFATDRIQIAETEENFSTKVFMVDYDYLSTMGMELVAGRDFSMANGTDKDQAFIINETAAKNFGLGTAEEALGKRLNWDPWESDSLKRGEVIGVVKDFHTGSLKEMITPLVMQIDPAVFYTLTVKLNKENIQEQLKTIEAVFTAQVPDGLFSYSFIDQNFEKMYVSEQKLSKLLGIFAGLSILVACMGLFGLVEYDVNQRVKEISIRKIFGANTGSILVKLTKQYFLLVLISFIIAAPLIWYGANQWLQNFAYHVDITPMIFIKAAILIVLITVITVSFQSIKAILSNPARVLRND